MVSHTFIRAQAGAGLPPTAGQRGDRVGAGSKLSTTSTSTRNDGPSAAPGFGGSPVRHARRPTATAGTSSARASRHPEAAIQHSTRKKPKRRVMVVGLPQPS